MTELSDVDLVGWFLKGDRHAFTALVRRWEGFVLRVAARVTVDRNEAEEVRQAVFLRLLESPAAVRQPDRFAAWLHRTTVNEAISAVRRRTRRERLAAGLRARSVAVETVKPCDVVVAADEAEQLSTALGRLEPDERSLLALRFDEGLTFSEIAAALGEPASTIKTRTARLVARLRVMLDVDAPAG
ncbi:RNA polymerase sigma-70 factor, ECF subfamily [Singulisphaera sp. GP187]|uniref:RNA polymerase sigma factor n=1 Tax=Singulisphaera sp. GP187 TaxID=1882752 RepID=UPI000926E0CE|nr:sigma-70 family RNA polymerase sigma factor [Singulisphaera sp. GP187]SIO56287.1 RNA polymerase sigma-70 factor, ECF subfamily [Singulisphaera sp. GP187]